MEKTMRRNGVTSFSHDKLEANVNQLNTGTREGVGFCGGIKLSFPIVKKENILLK